MTTTVQQRNGFGSRLFSRGKEFGPVWPLFLRSRKGATRTVRAAAAQAARDPRGRSFFGLVDHKLWCTGNFQKTNSTTLAKGGHKRLKTSDTACGVSGRGAAAQLIVSDLPWHGAILIDI